MRTYEEAVTEEYNWITETITDLWKEAFEAGKTYDLEIIKLGSLAWNFHSRLLTEDGYATDFFHTMESLKGICGDLGRAIRDQKLPDHIQKMLEEERRGFGLEY
jgi:hypothetical protein